MSFTELCCTRLQDNLQGFVRQMEPCTWTREQSRQEQDERDEAMSHSSVGLRCSCVGPRERFHVAYSILSMIRRLLTTSPKPYRHNEGGLGSRVVTREGNTFQTAVFASTQVDLHGRFPTRKEPDFGRGDNTIDRLALTDEP